MIFIIDDDAIMAACIGRASKTDFRIFYNAFAAIRALEKGPLPDLIFLDILLSGPNSFTFLNELASYRDTAKIPIIIVSALDFSQQNLENYGVVGFLNKDTMLPKDIRTFVKKFSKKLVSKTDLADETPNLAASARMIYD